MSTQRIETWLLFGILSWGMPFDCKFTGRSLMMWQVSRAFYKNGLLVWISNPFCWIKHNSLRLSCSKRLHHKCCQTSAWMELQSQNQSPHEGRSPSACLERNGRLSDIWFDLSERFQVDGTDRWAHRRYSFVKKYIDCTKNPDPSKVAILRTWTLLNRFNPSIGARYLKASCLHRTYILFVWPQAAGHNATTVWILLEGPVSQPKS